MFLKMIKTVIIDRYISENDANIALNWEKVGGILRNN